MSRIRPRLAAERCCSVLLLVLLLAVSLGGCVASGSGLAMGPYTAFASPTSAKVLWVTEPGSTANSAIFVDQGAIANVETKLIPGQKELLHVATITGLQPRLTYRYKIVFTREGKSVGEFFGEFQAAPVQGSADPIRFAVYGDTRSFPDRHNSVATAIDREGHIAFVIHSGDIVSNGDVWRLWKKEFFDPAKDMLRDSTIWVALGNHEQGGEVARSLFDLPKSYYSFDYGNVHWAVIDSSLAEKPGEIKKKTADPEMLAWLEKDLAASKATWKFVAYHRPTFDIITHRTTWGQNDLLPVLERGGVDMVFAGHTHNYQRFRPIGQAGQKPIIFVVSAGGGAPNYPVNPAPIIEKSYSGMHYGMVTVSGNTLYYTAKLPDGTVLDEVTLVKNNGMFQKDVMDRAVTTTFARNTSFLLTGIYARSKTPPVPGQPFNLEISPLQFPEGATVEIDTAIPLPSAAGEKPHGNWTIKPVTISDWKGNAEVPEDPTASPLDPFHLTAIPPSDLDVTMKGFTPQIRVRLRVTYKGQAYTTDNAGVFFYSTDIKAWQVLRHAATGEPIPPEKPLPKSPPVNLWRRPSL